jgi:branched-chain amino acid transport system ATP-binding protein
MREGMLEVRSVTAGYGRNIVLQDVSLTIGDGEAITILGANGAGKSTLMRAVVGMLPLRSGEIRFDGERIDGRSTAQIVKRGLVLCPEARHLFPQMSVRENLVMGAYSRRRDRRSLHRDVDDVLAVFPQLAPKLRLHAGSLSGGEQQMLAIGRALMARPRMLLLDEPSLGLAPLLVEAVMREIASINSRGIAVGLVEQNAAVALETVSRGYVLESGQIALEGSAESLAGDDRVRAAYLGVVDAPVE